jgi:small GTP-binding protein
MESGLIFEYFFKLIVLGKSNTGKSAMVHKFVNDKYLSTYKANIAIDFKVKRLTIPSANDSEHALKVHLQVWDTAGDAKNRKLNQNNWLRRSNGIFLVYDVNDQNSLEACVDWIRVIREKQMDDSIVYLVANKVDASYTPLAKSLLQQGKDLAEQEGLMFWEVSARTDQNVTECFTDMARDIEKHFNRRKYKQPEPQEKKLEEYPSLKNPRKLLSKIFSKRSVQYS